MRQFPLLLGVLAAFSRRSRGVLAAFSQAPSPSGGKGERRPADAEAEKKQSPPTNTQHNLATRQTVPALTPSTGENKPTDTTGKQESKSPADVWLIGTNVLLAIATGALAFMAWLQWRAMKRQEGLMESQVSALNAQAEWMRQTVADAKVERREAAERRREDMTIAGNTYVALKGLVEAVNRIR